MNRLTDLIRLWAIGFILMGLAISGCSSAVGHPTEIREGKPWVIDQPGIYRLKADIHAQGDAIHVKADGVTLDLAGHTISGPGCKDSHAIGIQALGRRRIKIVNGTIRGFMYAVQMLRDPDPKRSAAQVQDIIIERIVALDNTFRAFRVDGSGVTIRENIIRRTGGTLVYPDAFAMGIEVIGPNALIENNRIFETVPVGIGEGVAISLSSEARGSLVRGNYLSNRVRTEYGRTFAFWIGGSSRKVVVSDNIVIGFTHGFWHDNEAVYIGNVFSYTECNPLNRRHYYDRYSYLSQNKFLYNRDVCSDSVKEFLDRAQAGDVRAQFRVAMAPDCQDRMGWLKKAADGGLPEAQRVFKKMKQNKAPKAEKSK